MSFADLIYQSINADYGYGKLGEFKLIIRKRDGWVNVNKMCKDGGKEFKKWKRTKVGQEILDSYSRDIDALGVAFSNSDPKYSCIHLVSNRDLIGETDENIQLIQGNYVPDEVAIVVGQWVSVDYTKKVAKIIINPF